MSVRVNFPILLTYGQQKNNPDWPRSVPWSMIEPHERQARINHDQILERLAERGGLTPLELRRVLEDRPFDASDIENYAERNADAANWLNEQIGEPSTELALRD